MIPSSKNMLHGSLELGQYLLLDSPWQIVQIAETAEPGVFRLWVLVGPSLHSVRLTVPRMFYVNELRARASDSGQYWRQCSRVLPSGRVARHIYQYTMPEDVYQEQREKLIRDLSGPELEGIYETQLSLELRAVIQLGCICTVDKYEARRLKRIGQKDIDSINLNHLEFKKVSQQQPYLQKKNGVSPFKHILLYQFHDECTRTSVNLWALIFVDVKGYIYTMEDNKYRDVRLREINDVPGSKKIKCELKRVDDEKQIYEDIEQALALYRDSCDEPTVVVVVARMSTAQLVERIPGLSEFPLVRLYCNQTELHFYDGQNDDEKCVIHRVFDGFVKYLDEMIEQCRYFHVPLGNYNAVMSEPYANRKPYWLINDYPLRSAADVTLARRLTRSATVLGWDRAGGGHTYDYRLSVTDRQGARGVYRGVCVELDYDLMVNAVLRAPTLLQMENASSAGTQDTSAQGAQGTAGLSNLYEATQCSGALQILRAMVKSWHNDVTHDDNRVAEGQLSMFYRWLMSPSSALTSSSLKAALHTLSSRLLTSLMTSLSRLGCTVIFADNFTVILASYKSDIYDATSYVESVVRALKCDELFRDIRFRYKQCWAGLLWRDHENYAGKKIRLPVESSLLLPIYYEEKVHEKVQRSKPDFMHPEWKIGHYLPFLVRDIFWKALEDYANTFENDLKPKQLVTLFNEEISKNIYKQTENIMATMPTLTESLTDDVLGVKLAKSVGATPALLFVNAVCDMLAVDKEIHNEVVSFRRSLLQLTGFEEHTLAADWHDPGYKFQLPDYICDNCNKICPQLPFVFPFRADILRCHDINRNGCGRRRDAKQVEWQLIEAVNELTEAYTVQDLVCERCHQVCRGRLSTSCRCSGQLSAQLSLHNLAHQLRSIRVMADCYKMTLLQEILHFHMSKMFTTEDYFSLI